MPEEEEVAGVEPEREPHLFNLVDEAIDLPQRRSVRLVAVRGAELVVVVVLDLRIRQIAVAALEVLVRGTRAAVQQQQLASRAVADTLGPDTKRPLRRGDRDEAHATAENVVAFAVVEVRAHREPGALPLRTLGCLASRRPGRHRRRSSRAG